MAHILFYMATQTHTRSKSLTEQPLLYLRLKVAQIKPAKTSVKIRVIGKKRIPNEINFDKIYLNNHETNVKNKFTECRSRYFLRETSNVFALLSKLSDEHNTRESILAQTSPSNESTIDMNTFLQADFHIILRTIRNNLSTWNVICKLYDVKHSQSGSTIILPSVGGKDTDPNLAYEILQYGINLFLNQKETCERTFIGGDQKTMGVAMRLKKQYENFNQIY